MQTIPAYVGSLVTMICDVEANPANVTFFWQSKQKDLRSTKDLHDLRSSIRSIGRHLHIKNRAMKSRLEIRIESRENFGQYLCYAQNLAGVQDEPCFYNVYGKFDTFNKWKKLIDSLFKIKLKTHIEFFELHCTAFSVYS